MTKARKITLIISIVIAISSQFFLPCRLYRLDEDGNAISYIRLRPSFIDLVKAEDLWDIPEIAQGTRIIVIVGISVLAAATLIAAGPIKKNWMNRNQKAIIMIAAALITAALLFPPVQYYKLGAGDTREIIAADWTFIFNMKIIFKADKSYIFPYVRFKIYFLEIFGILVLAGAGLLITKKK